MTEPNDDAIDREAILARRALFISSALAVLGCGPRPADLSVPPPEPEPEALGRLPALSRDPKAIPSPSPEPDPASTLTLDRLEPWPRVAALAPPLEVPPGLSPVDARQLARQAEQLGSMHERLRRLWTEVPAICALSADDCRGPWTRFARDVAALLADVERLSGLCGLPASLRTTTVQRLRIHQQYLQRHLLLLSEAARSSHTLAHSQDTIYAQIEQEVAVPMPCLSCASTAGFDITGLVIHFPAMSTEIASPGPMASVEGLAVQLAASPALVLEVRGHGDPAEGAAAEALAEARARAVIDRLVALGISGDRLLPVAFGARLPVDSSARELTQHNNRRVDFELAGP